MTSGIAWACLGAFILGIWFGAALASAIIIGVRLKIDVVDAHRRELAIARRYAFPKFKADLR